MLKVLVISAFFSQAQCQSERPLNYTPPVWDDTIVDDSGENKTLEGRSSLKRGRTASTKDAPYHVIIQYKYQYRCSGAFVIGAKGQHIIATSADCVMDPWNTKEATPIPASDLRVIAGRRFRSQGELHEQQRNVRRVRHHRGLWRPSHENDFAILYLSKEFQLREDLQPIGLPMKNWPISKYYTVVGWSETGELRITDQIELVKHWDCYVHYNWIYKQYGVFESQLCLEEKGQKGMGHCYGDEGAAAIGISRGEQYLVGIFQWKHPPCDLPYPSICPCQDNGYPAIYADMRTFGDWIDVVTLESDVTTPDGYGRRK